MKERVLRTIAVLLLVLVSCSPEEQSSNVPINSDGGSISRYQMVIVDMGSQALSEIKYDGVFAGNSIKLNKVSDHELSFYVPSSTALGNTQLILSSFGNAVVNYQVTDAILTQSVDQTLTPFNSHLQAFESEFTAVPSDAVYQNNYNAFMQYMNNLSDIEKEEVAKFYAVNKGAIDAVFTTDYEQISGRDAIADHNFQENRATILKFKAAVAIGVMAAVVAILEPTGTIKVVAVGVAIISIIKAIQYHEQLAEANISTVEILVNNIMGTNNRSAAPSALVLPDNVTRTVPLAVNARPYIASDSNSDQSFTKLYFDTKLSLNAFIADTNEAIEWVNENVPFITMSPLPLATVPAIAPKQTIAANQEILQKITFSVNHPNLSLISVSFQALGELNLKVKVVNSPQTLPVESILSYTYADGFSRFSGSIPITVGALTPQQVTVTIAGGLAPEITALGETRQLSAQVLPLGVNQNVVWSVSNNSQLASVSSTGLVTGTGFGNIKVRATSVEDNTKYGEIDLSIIPTGCTGINSVTDIDGNTYSVITLFGNCVTRENLTVSHYRNGDPIPQVQDPAQWANLTTGAWCYYNNDPANENVYGKLYNHYAVVDPRGLAPEGWYVSAGMVSNDINGGSLKAISGWQAPNIGATNLTGYTGLPGGFRSNSGSFNGLGTFGFFWWGSDIYENEAVYLKLYYNSAGGASLFGSRNCGFSVRLRRE